MTISLTSAALEQITKEINKQSPAIGVRLHLEVAGCSGYKYCLNSIETIVDASDLCFMHPGVTLYVAAQDYPRLNGTTIDFVRDGLNAIFKYHNPHETGSCGCGESFTVDNISHHHHAAL